MIDSIRHLIADWRRARTYGWRFSRWVAVIALPEVLYGDRRSALPWRDRKADQP
jgi:hypothetical protein